MQNFFDSFYWKIVSVDHTALYFIAQILGNDFNAKVSVCVKKAQVFFVVFIRATINFEASLKKQVLNQTDQK